MHLSFIFAAVVEIPAFSIPFIINYNGRRWTLFTAFLVAGASSMFYAFVPPGMSLDICIKNYRNICFLQNIVLKWKCFFHLFLLMQKWSMLECPQRCLEGCLQQVHITFAFNMLLKYFLRQFGHQVYHYVKSLVALDCSYPLGSFTW